jgi:DNA modification methylase
MPATGRDLVDWLREHTAGAIAVIEKVGGYIGIGGRNVGPGPAMFKFGFSAGFAHGCLTALGIPHEEVAPKRWQQALGIPARRPAESKAQWKARLRGEAQRRFPNVKVTLATADALLIALYCRRVAGVPAGAPGEDGLCKAPACPRTSAAAPGRAPGSVKVSGPARPRPAGITFSGASKMVQEAITSTLALSAAVASVLRGESRWAIELADCIGFLRSLPENAVRLIAGSPPYPEKGQRYGTGKKWPTGAWVSWMLDVTEAAVRACDGMVLWVANGSVKDRRYLPACEGLAWEWHKLGGVCERPCIWHKNAPPNRKNWFGNDWEYVLAFTKPGATRVFNWKSIGTPPLYSNGGQFRQRTTNGSRRLGNKYPQNELTHPRDVFRVTVGGGHMGWRRAHEGEAPYPLKLVEPFIQALTNLGDGVCDPFMGSGTTAHAALEYGRKFIGCDNRPSQVELARARITEVLATLTDPNPNGGR